MQRTITATEWRATPKGSRVTKGHKRFVLRMKGGEARLEPVKVEPRKRDQLERGEGCQQSQAKPHRMTN